MPKVSVVIPIFNVEKYLKQCLDSVVNQTLKDIEIICVNDGSTDGSPAIIRSYAKKDRRIKVINKPNSGLGDTMNKGMSAATGDYIGIVESDDYAEPDMFETLYNTAVKHKADMVKGSYALYWSTPRFVPQHIMPKDKYNKVLDPIENPEVFNIPPSVWSAIYKRTFIEKNKIGYLPTPGASYQDTGFAFKALACAKRAVFLEKPFLNYRQDNEQSSIKNKAKILCIRDEYDEIKRFLTAHKKEQFMSIFYQKRLTTYFWNLSRLSPDNRKAFLEAVLPTFQETLDLAEKGTIKIPNGRLKRLKMLLHSPSRFLLRYRVKDFRKSISSKLFKH